MALAAILKMPALTGFRRRLAPAGLGLVVAVGLSACAPKAATQVVDVSGDQYPSAFDAAVEAARRHHMPAAIRDRRGGLIETAPAPAASLLEPWRGDNASLGQAADNTVNFHRRWARFEFIPAGVEGLQREEPRSSADRASAPASVRAPTLAPQWDLTSHGGPLELRVTVVIERAYMPGLRRDTWTQAKSTYTQIIPPDDADQPIPSQFWSAVDRDEEMERRLLREVRTLLAKPERDSGSR